MSFLKAEWRKLSIINYKIDPEIIKPFIPFGTELDLWEGNCYISLVGFMFINTKVLGLKIPFHVNFEEVNLRMYVKRVQGDEIKRGVVFIQEIVPKIAISLVANTLYSENYTTLPMDHKWEIRDNLLEVEYSWVKNSKKQSYRVYADLEPLEIMAGSEVEFITEHYWGYVKINENKTNEYQVTHPKWKHHSVNGYDLDVDFGLTYGDQFKFLNSMKPDSVFLAVGSEITVETKNIIHRK